MEFIDMHNHILPNIDDGSSSMEETIHMLRIAYDEGIRTIVTTSHFYPGRFEVPLERLKERFKEVKECAADVLPKVDLLLGCEIFYSHDSIRLVKEKVIPVMADTRYVLVEFSPLADYRYIKTGLQSFILEGYSPILAHVERYENVVNHIDKVVELIEMGVCIQVNAMSITGEMGRAYQSISKKLLKNHCVHIIATDAHGEKFRVPRLKKCYNLVLKKYGKEYADELFMNNQQKILMNQYVS